MSVSSSISLLRNIGVIAHIDAGKTTLTERLLFYTQKIHRMGEVHDGNATMDYLPEEQERGITISSACTSCTWNGHAINIIDTPGHVDFTIEVERSLRVLDGAVGVFCAVGGVEPQSETVWKQSENFSVPKIVFINKVDRVGADVPAVLAALKKRLLVHPVLLSTTAGTGENVSGIIDLLRLEKIVYDQSSQGQLFERVPLEGKEAEDAIQLREEALETLAENDEQFFEAYLGGVYDETDIKAGLRRATLARTLTPVFVGSALKNMGVQLVLDAICAYLPSPQDAVLQTTAVHEKVEAFSTDPDAPLLALVFKVIMDAGRTLTFVRLYAGTLRVGESCFNATRNAEERVSRIYQLHADRREQLESAQAGDIVALVGIRSAHTGDTLCLKNHPFFLESIHEYQPVISLALEPRTLDEGKTLDEALQRFQREDPTLRFTVDEDSGYRLVSGMGELHLEVLLERIHREYGIELRSGNPQVVQRETIRQDAEAAAEFDRELGKVHHYGQVRVRVSPQERGAGNRIQTENLPDVPTVWLDAVRQGIEDSLQSGVYTGYPVQDVLVTVLEMQKREGLSSPAGYHMAAVAAFKDALSHARPVALEPLMRVEINVPEDFLGAAISQFNGRNGKIEMVEDRAGQKNIQGLAPMRELFGFSTDLRSATQGRAGLVMRFERFDAA